LVACHFESKANEFPRLLKVGMFLDKAGITLGLVIEELGMLG